MPKCDFNKVAKQLVKYAPYLHGYSPVNMVHKHLFKRTPTEGGDFKSLISYDSFFRSSSV